MSKKIYKSRIDWWVWAVVLFTAVVVFVITISSPWWFAMIYGVGIIGTIVVSMFGCWYAIDGTDILVYQFFKAHRYPISKIREVKYCKGILAMPALSATRLALKFTDRSVLKSYIPLEISPADRDGFVRELLAVNQDIKIIKD